MKFKLNEKEKIVWKGKENPLGSTAFTFTMILGIFLITAGLTLLRETEILSIIGLALIGVVILSTRNHSTYIITNRRLKEVKVEEIAKLAEKLIEEAVKIIIDLTYILSGHYPSIGEIMGIGTLEVRNKNGKHYSRSSKKVKVKDARKAILSVLKEHGENPFI